MCDVDYNYSYNGSSNCDFDRVVRCYVENDSLKVLSYAFPFNSEDQTVFHKTLYGGSSSIKVTFSSQYNAISIEGDFPSQLAGPDSDITYTGMRTSLPETTNPHPCLDELEGVYDLDTYYRNDSDSIDTQYVSSAFVTMLGNYMTIDSDQFYVTFPFHSYFNQSVYYQNTSPKTRHNRSIQWGNNNLSLDYQTIYYHMWSPVPMLNDTIHYIISGTK